MDTIKNAARAFSPQWIPAICSAGTTLWLLWGLHPIVLATIALSVGVGIFFVLVFIGMAFDW